MGFLKANNDYKKRKKGFIGIEYVIALSIVLIGGIGVYLNSQDTIKDTQKEGSVIMSDKDADLITGIGTPGDDLTSSITVTPETLFLENVGDSGQAIVTLKPETSWRKKLVWQDFANTTYCEFSQTEGYYGYRVDVKGRQKGVCKYKVRTEDGSPVSKIFNVQVGQPSEFIITPNNQTIDGGKTLTLTLSNSDNYWSNIIINDWQIMSGGDLISLTPSADKKTATVTAKKPNKGGTAQVKVNITDNNYQIDIDAFATIKINKDFETRFDANKGTGSFANLYAAGGRTVTIPTGYTPSRTGYTFNGYKLSIREASKSTGVVDDSTLYKPGDTYKMPTQDNTMTAQWTANNYKVIFDLNYNNQILKEVNMAYESPLGALPSPTRTGYTFLGWYTDKTGGTKITQNTKVPLNGARYYAHWDANSYSVSYNLNGGSGTFATQTGKFDTTITLHNAKPTRNYYTFTGWLSSADSKTYQPNGSFKIPAKNSAMTAQWSANTYKINYVLNGGAINGTYPTSYKTTDNITLPTNVTRTGYTFNGWYTTSNFSGSSVKNIPVGSGGDKTYYAKWTPNTFTLTFNANGGSVSPGSKSVTYGSSIGTLPTPSRTGYTFNGWYDGNTKWNSNQTYNVNGNKTLTASWTANKYTLYFNGNGGSASYGSKTVTYGQKIGSMASASRSNYNFTGWYTAGSGGVQWNENTVWQQAGNATVYAHWNPAYASVQIYNDITGGSSTHNIPIGGSANVGGLGAAGFNFKSYSTTNSGIATVSGTTIYAHSPQWVQIRSNWALQNPGMVGRSGTTCTGTRSSLFNASAAGSRVIYFTAHTNTSDVCAYQGEREYPSSYANNGSTREVNRVDTKYICGKVCDSGNNYDGSNRCSAYTRVWVGAAQQQPSKKKWTNPSSGSSYTQYDEIWDTEVGTGYGTMYLDNKAYSWSASAATSRYATGLHVYKILYDVNGTAYYNKTDTSGYHECGRFKCKARYYFKRSTRANHNFTYGNKGCSLSTWTY